MNKILAQFKQVMVERGAIFSEGDAARPEHFGSPELEENAADQNAVLFDLTSNRLFELTGNDRHDWLHNFSTNDIKALQPGDWSEAFIPDIKSHALGHGLIFAEADSLWVEMPPLLSDQFLPHFNRFMMLDDIEMQEKQDEWGLLFLSGPQSSKVFKSAELPGTNQHRIVELFGTQFSVARVDRLNQPGYLLKMPLEEINDLWQAIIHSGVQPSGEITYNSLRIAAGYPLYGVDISEKELVQEVDRASTAISFTKGCYLGQEPIARIDSLGHVNRKLCRLQIALKPGTYQASAIYSATDNKEVGKITSAAYSHLNETQMALGYIKTKALTSEDELYILSDENPVPITT